VFVRRDGARLHEKSDPWQRPCGEHGSSGFPLLPVRGFFQRGLEIGAMQKGFHPIYQEVALTGFAIAGFKATGG